MIHQLLTLLFILCLFLWNKRVKRGVVNVSGYIILIYLISIVLSFPYVKEFNLERVVYKTHFIWYGLWFCLLLLLFLFPLLKFDEAKKKCIVLPPQNILELFAIAIGALSLLSIIYFVPIVVKVFSVHDMSVARYMATSGGNSFIKEGLLNTIASVSSSFFGICVCLGYIFYIQHKVKLAGFMLLSSLAYVFNVLSYVGRDGVVFWAMSMIFGFIIFHNYMTVVQKKIIMSLFILVLVCFSFLFIGITSDRFVGQSFLVSIIDYYGQPYPNFCLFMDVDYPISWGSGFPLFRELLGMGEVTSFGNWQMGDTVSWVFGTFIKSLHGNFGPGWTLLIALISALLISVLLKPRSVNLGFNTLFIFIMYFDIISQGVFYFRQYTRGSNLYILMSFVFYFVFAFFCEKSGNVLIKPKR